MPAVATVIYCDPEILRDELVFVGANVLLPNLSDYLAADGSLENSLEAFPSGMRLLPAPVEM